MPDGDELRPAAETYFERAGRPREAFTRARRPAGIVLACVAGAAAGLSAFVASTWRWGATDPAARAADVIARTGMGQVPPGQVLLYDVVFGVVALLVWAAVVATVWRGVGWSRWLGLAVAALSLVLAVLALPAAHVPVEHVTAWVSLASSALVAAMLLVPHREWFDWRRHGPTVARAPR